MEWNGVEWILVEDALWSFWVILAPCWGRKSVNRFLGSGSRVAYLKVIPLEASFSCASDGAIDKPHGIK